MSGQRSDGPVLVGVKNPDDVQQLVRTAADIARLASGQLRIVTVAVKPRDSPFGVFTDETIVDEFAADSHELLERASPPSDVTVSREVVVARSAANGLLEAIDEFEPSALVVGWTGRSRPRDPGFGTTVDALVERAPCDLYVERVGREAGDVASILLPVAGGPHVDVAASAAAAIADRNEAAVRVVSVADSSHDGATANGFVEEGSEAIRAASGAAPSVETAVLERDDVTDAIVDAAGEHDVVVMGATRRGTLKRKIAGSVPRAVVDRIDETVILARDAATVGGRTYLPDDVASR